jgi:hypothetical protein
LAGAPTVSFPFSVKEKWERETNKKKGKRERDKLSQGLPSLLPVSTRHQPAHLFTCFEGKKMVFF